MLCPKCGYMMDAFDVECPRCKRMGIGEEKDDGKTLAKADDDPVVDAQVVIPKTGFSIKRVAGAVILPLFGILIVIFILAQIDNKLFEDDLNSPTPSPASESSSEPSSKIIDIPARVAITDTQMVVTNTDTSPWSDIEVTINPSGMCAEGYSCHLNSLNPGESYTIGLLNFADKDGKRFNPFDYKIQQVVVTAGTTKGTGMWTGVPQQ